VSKLSEITPKMTS